MHITDIRLQNFRNYADRTVELTEKVNLITGKNAQGKTNLLESIFVCCVGKSVRARDRELIAHGQDRARIRMTAERFEGRVLTEMVLSRGENKRILVNGIPLSRTGELLGTVKAIYFSPEDLKLIKDAPDSRRRFLDMDLSQIYKNYYYALTRYNRALLSRNNLLKKYPEHTLPDLLYPYDVQLVKEGAKILKYRLEYVEKLKITSKKVHSYLTSDEEELEISYASNIPREGDIEANYAHALEDSRDKDIKLKFTTAGIHRDDIKITANGLDIRIYGSQGQQRTAALSLKLAELELFEEISNDLPVLLLDDVFSELDERRQRRLLEFCGTVQSVITATHVDPGLLEGLPVAVYRVESGNVERLAGGETSD